MVYRSSVFLLFFFLTSCQGNLNFIPQDMPEKLSVVAIIDADDTARSIIIEKSYQDDYSGESSDSLKGVNLGISLNDYDIFNYLTESSTPRKISINIPNSLSFTTGEQYLFHASERNTESISSESMPPALPGSFSVSFIEVINSTLKPPLDFYNPVKTAVLNLSFATQPGSFSFLVIESIFSIPGRLDQSCYVGYNIVNSNSPGFSAFIPGLIKHDFTGLGSILSYPVSPYSVFFIDGNTVPGNKCDMNIAIQLHQDLFNYEKPIKIKLCSATKELYYFEKSLFTYYKNLSDPFSEPVYIDGNIKGGNGIFAIYRSISDTLTLPWETIF